MTPKNNTVLHVAALFGNTKSVKVILALSSSLLLSRVNIRGETALHIAAKEGHLDIVHLLVETAKTSQQVLESGITLVKEMLRITDKDEDTALHKAVRNRQCNVVKILAKEDPEFAFPPNKAGETPVYLAAEGGCNVCLSQILNICVSPAYDGPCGRTALHAAAIFNYQGLCEEADTYGWTPLHYAALFGHVQRVRQILIINMSQAYLATNKDQVTALHIAASQGHTKVMTELLSYCPDCWEMVNDKGQNILHVAVANEKANVIRFIIDSSLLSSLIDERDLDGNTPLHLLATSGRFVPGLIMHPRANKMAFNNDNMTPLDEAYKYTSDWGLIKRTMRIVGGFGLRDVVRDYDEIVSEEKPSDKDLEVIQEMRKEADTSLIVATLIATVTFAAGFTLPGGYDSNSGPNKGLAILTRKAAFKAFVITDTIALVSSTCAVFVYFMKADYVYRHKLVRHYTSTKSLVTIAMGALVLAFVTGLYAVLPHSSGLAISTAIMGCSSFLVYYWELRPAFSTIRGRPKYLYSEHTNNRGRPTYIFGGNKKPPQKFVRF
ncbi:hypothetical protein ACH5RR_031418 [Cinchona calisaya]|uniref:PGG domain-containing protein n=1 Tax=Cinchona calisaya TaxID=153742 RepID=A0ABD2YH49_9GENT